MYNIIQLNDKNLSELQVIAKELGIKKADSYKKEDLVYKKKKSKTGALLGGGYNGYCRN